MCKKFSTLACYDTQGANRHTGNLNFVSDALKVCLKMNTQLFYYKCLKMELLTKSIKPACNTTEQCQFKSKIYCQAVPLLICFVFCLFCLFVLFCFLPVTLCLPAKLEDIAKRQKMTQATAAFIFLVLYTSAKQAKNYLV